MKESEAAAALRARLVPGLRDYLADEAMANRIGCSGQWWASDRAWSSVLPGLKPPKTPTFTFRAGQFFDDTQRFEELFAAEDWERVDGMVLKLLLKPQQCARDRPFFCTSRGVVSLVHCCRNPSWNFFLLCSTRRRRANGKFVQYRTEVLTSAVACSKDAAWCFS